jgi:(1->4)-alpha-D-glucan 1-alpha-D-glucosylmutase
MAKGLEDTACYVYNRFVAVNDVGGSPKQFGFSTEEFHRGNLQRAERFPNSILSTSTHDSKRGEDVRARLDVLSEMPTAWSSAVMRWRRMNQSQKPVLSDGRAVPDSNEEYLLYQTLVGTWPFHFSHQAERDDYTFRIQRYMNKAVHEAKVNLSWVNENPEYLAALHEFIKRILQPADERRRNSFTLRVNDFVKPIAFFGAINSLAQLVLKMASPGVPDIYQGNELWRLRLVDPDNRGPVDFDRRQRLLDDLLDRAASGAVSELCRELLANYDDGRIKLWTTMRALNFRREHEALFRSGGYVPLSASSDKQAHLVTFARVREDEVAIVAVPRLAYTLMKGRVQPPIADAWNNAELMLPPEASGARLLNIFTGEVLSSANGRTLPCREVFARFPVALLASY